MTTTHDCPPVLVLDGQFLSALAAVRSLGRKGLRVEVASPETSPISGYSRHCRRHHLCPDPVQETDRFLSWLLDWTCKHPGCVLLPITEKTLIPLAEHRDRFPADCTLCIPPGEALGVVLDKQRTAELAASLGIPVPEGREYRELQTLKEARDDISLPVAIKPGRSIPISGGRLGPQLSVGYAFDSEELLRRSADLLQHGPVLVQEYFQGVGVGIEVIADRGEVLYAFQHQRLHEVPLTGGGSSLRACVEPNDQLLSDAKRLMYALGWHGVAMVEFKLNPDTGQYRLMEINGRFWGSLPLSVAAGADFPWLCYQLHRGQAVDTLEPANVGVQCRDLNKDIYWHEQVLRRASDPRLFRYPSKKELALGWLKVFSPKHYFDAQSLSDPLPGLMDLGRLLGAYGSRVGDLLRQRLWKQRERIGLRLGIIPRRIARARKILFLCYGNINRSALAHAYLSRRLQTGGLPVQLVSAGLHPVDGRPADPNMVEVCRELGVDLGSWHSSTVTEEMLRDVDLVLAMEFSQLSRLKSVHPTPPNARLHLLGTLLDDGRPEIADPYGKASEDYRRCADRVIAACDRLIVSLGVEAST